MCDEVQGQAGKSALHDITGGTATSSKSVSKLSPAPLSSSGLDLLSKNNAKQSRFSFKAGGRRKPGCKHRAKHVILPRLSLPPPPQSDFLSCYVSYLKELPECLSVISLLASGSVKSFVFLEVKRSSVANMRP